MTSVVAVWDRKEKAWTFDCPHCGKTNFTDLHMSEIPDEVQEPESKIVGKIECFVCHEDSVAFFSLASVNRRLK